MNFEKIFERVTIRGVIDYLLFGIGLDEDNRSYEKRLDDLYMKFEKAVKKYDNRSTSELLALLNELFSETARVYVGIGLQAGLLLIKDMIKNIRAEKETAITDFVNMEDEFNVNAILLEEMYKKRVEVRWKRYYRKTNDIRK